MNRLLAFSRMRFAQTPGVGLGALLYLSFQRQIVGGLTSGSVK